MKKLIGVLAFTVVISFGQRVMAQNFKFGHINSDELFMLMPERDTVIAQLEASSDRAGKYGGDNAG